MLTRDEQHAQAHALLGAEHAQIGLYKRAVDHIERALAIDPGLHIARFQLGLLHLTSGRVEAAAESWGALDGLEPQHPLRLFKTGLLHLARDDFDACESCLRRGIEFNADNEPLNADMRKVLESIESQRQQGNIPQATAAAPGQASAERSFFLSAYAGTAANG